MKAFYRLEWSYLWDVLEYKLQRVSPDAIGSKMGVSVLPGGNIGTLFFTGVYVIHSGGTVCSYQDLPAPNGGEESFRER